MGAGDVKLAAVDVLSVGGGFVLGAGELTRYSALHPGARPAAAVAAAVLCGVAVAATVQYVGLRLLGRPLAGPSAAALLSTLSVPPAAAAALATVLERVAPGPALVPVLAVTAAVATLGTPAATRDAVARWCRPARPSSPRAARPDVLRFEDGG